MGLAALVVTTLVVATLCVCPTSGGSSAVSSGDKRVQTSTSLFDRIARKQGSGRSRFGEDDSQAATADGREKPIVSSERRAGTSTGRTQPVSASRSGDAVRSNSRSKNVSPLEVTTKTDAEPDVATPQRSAQSGSGTSSRSRVRPSDAASHTESETNDDESRTCEIREQPHTIVDVQQSFKKGAEGILKTNTTYDDCITQCCANKQCNTAVFESGSSHSGTSSRRTRTSTCYLFNCDNLHANRCVLSAHPQYTTIQMAAAFRALGERCDERATDYCRDMQAVCTNSVCECAQGYVKQYGRCVPLRCGPDEFQCWSLPNATESQAPVCIASYNRCDSRHIPQCPDGSDEFDCAEGTVDSAARGDPNPNPNPNRHSSNGKSKSSAPAQAPANDQQRSGANRVDDADVDETDRSRGVTTTRAVSRQRVTATPKTKAKPLELDTHDQQTKTRTRVEENENESENEVYDSAPNNAPSATEDEKDEADFESESKNDNAKDDYKYKYQNQRGSSSSGSVRPNVSVSVSGSRGKPKGSEEEELTRTTAKADRRKPTPAPVFDTESETDDAYDRPYNRRPAESGNSKSNVMPVRPLTSTVKPQSRSKVKSTASGSYGQVARVLNDLRERQRIAKTSRRPAQYFTSDPQADDDLDASASLSDTDRKQQAVESKWRKPENVVTNWKPRDRHVTTRPPMFDDWYELPMPPDEPEQEQEQEQEQEDGCVTDYEAFTEAGAGRYTKRNRTLCTPYDFAYDTANGKKVKSKPKTFEPDTHDRQTASSSRDRQSTSSSRDRDRDRSRSRNRDVERPSKSQQDSDAYYTDTGRDVENDNEVETEEYDYDEAPHYYDDVMSDSESPRMRGRGRERERERSRYGYGKPSSSSSFSNGRGRADEDEQDYEAAVEPQRNRVASFWSRSRARTTGATNSRKTTARAGLPISTPKAAARIDDAPQPFDSVFGANITQMWNVHAILNGLFEHRGAQLEDSSVSEQNALIVAIVLLVGGLVMTTVLITLVGCNLRRLLGLSKRRYPRRSANGDAERLVNGLNL